MSLCRAAQIPPRLHRTPLVCTELWRQADSTRFCGDLSASVALSASFDFCRSLKPKSGFADVVISFVTNREVTCSTHRRPSRPLQGKCCSSLKAYRTPLNAFDNISMSFPCPGEWMDCTTVNSQENIGGGPPGKENIWTGLGLIYVQ